MIREWLYRQGVSKKQFLFLIVFVCIALGHAIIANDKFIVGKSPQGFGFFINDVEGNSGIKTLIPYSSKTIDRKNRLVGPFEKQDVKSIYYRHWLGTDILGRDVLAGVIYGSFIAMLVGFLTVFLALIIGVFMGYLSGYYGDTGIQLKKTQAIIWIVFSVLCWFYSYYASSLVSLFLFVLPIILLLFFLKNSTGIRRDRISFPFDSIIFRIIEILNSIPDLFFIIILLAILGEPSIWKVILVIGFLRWPTVTRHLRAEILKIKAEEYIEAAKSIGQSDWKIFMYHVLPMAISPIITVCAFSFSSAILFESTLSFLGFGIPIDEVTWGALIRDARFDFKAWWLAVFPGLLIYGLIYLFNSIGDNINNRFRALS